MICFSTFLEISSPILAETPATYILHLHRLLLLYFASNSRIRYRYRYCIKVYQSVEHAVLFMARKWAVVPRGVLTSARVMNDNDANTFKPICISQSKCACITNGVTLSFAWFVALISLVDKRD